jgi:hypothetical protein
MTPSPTTVTFAQVKGILDRLVAGREDLLPPLHGDQLRWSCKSELSDAVVRPYGTGEPYRLISPELVGVGRAKETFLYRILATGFGKFDRMPFGGPYATCDELKAIRDWIDTGMP